MVEKDVYKIVEIKTQIQRGEISSNIEDLIKNRIKDGLIIGWFYQEVLFGEIRNGNINFYNNKQPNYEKNLIRVRIFNENEEFYLWKKNGKWHYRYIKEDNDGDNFEVIDAEQVMFGTKSGNNIGGFVKISEERGIEYFVPSKVLNNRNLGRNKRLVLKTRNYIKYNKIGQAGFVDSRFVKIYVMDVKL